MNAKQIGLSVVLFDFTALTFYALYRHGLAGFVDLATANAATVTILADLLIALGMVVVWMWRDARARGRSPLPYVLITLALGSVGPLLYLIRTAAGPAAATARPPLATREARA